MKTLIKRSSLPLARGNFSINSGKICGPMEYTLKCVKTGRGLGSKQDRNGTREPSMLAQYYVHDVPVTWPERAENPVWNRVIPSKIGVLPL